MSLDYKTINIYPSIRVIPGNTVNTEIVLPKTANKLTIACDTRDFYVAFTGTDGGVPVTDKVHMPSGGFISFDLAKGSNRSNYCYVATEYSSGDITLIFEE